MLRRVSVIVLLGVLCAYCAEAGPCDTLTGARMQLCQQCLSRQVPGPAASTADNPDVKSLVSAQVANSGGDINLCFMCASIQDAGASQDCFNCIQSQEPRDHAQCAYCVFNNGMPVPFKTGDFNDFIPFPIRIPEARSKCFRCMQMQSSGVNGDKRPCAWCGLAYPNMDACINCVTSQRPVSKQLCFNCLAAEFYFNYRDTGAPGAPTPAVTSFYKAVYGNIPLSSAPSSPSRNKCYNCLQSQVPNLDALGRTTRKDPYDRCTFGALISDPVISDAWYQCVQSQVPGDTLDPTPSNPPGDPSAGGSDIPYSTPKSFCNNCMTFGLTTEDRLKCFQCLKQQVPDFSSTSFPFTFKELARTITFSASTPTTLPAKWGCYGCAQLPSLKDKCWRCMANGVPSTAQKGKCMDLAFLATYN